MTNFDRFHIVDIRQFHIGLHYTQPIKLFASSAIQEQLELFLGAEFYCCMRLLTATCTFRTENDFEGLIKLFAFLFQVVLFRDKIKYVTFILQCFDAVGWAAVRASGL